ncbi:MAG: DivIVA domain-containing protein [Actinobacteria bacterium]|nr:DivIVA domain-containing protein [Actinomycetota bacterium]
MDLTSWWPRPKSESIVDQLAALQARSGVVPDPAALPTGVRPGGAFPKSRGEGYDPQEVDALLARLAELGPGDLRSAQFATVPKRGYDKAAVDTTLEHLASIREA